MLIKEITVNGTEYKLTLTDQLVNQVNNLKSLYNAAYEDPESFEQVSSDISNSINDIAAQAEPPVEGDDLDGFIQVLIKAVDEKTEELREEMQEKASKPKDEKSGRPAKRKNPKK